MEMSTDENEAIVRRVCEYVSAERRVGREVTPERQLIHDVDYLLLEANSGASYEQYFRWAPLNEIGRIVSGLRTVGLHDVADLTERAIRIAFPNGIPATTEEKSELTEWSESQDRKLRDLFHQLEPQIGRIINTLAAFAVRAGACLPQEYSNEAGFD